MPTDTGWLSRVDDNDDDDEANILDEATVVVGLHAATRLDWYPVENKADRGEILILAPLMM